MSGLPHFAAMSMTSSTRSACWSGSGSGGPPIRWGPTAWSSWWLRSGCRALAYSGLRFAPHRDETGLVAALGVAGFVAVIAAAVPPTASVVDAVTDTVVFAPIRESHRLIVFTVFALVVFAVRGAEVATARHQPSVRVGAAVVLGAGAIAVIAPSLWGLDDQIERVEIPAAWDDVVAVIEGEPGTTLVLPWSQYFDVAIASGRRSHHPLPFLLPGDLISRHDLGIGGDGTVRDEREVEVSRVLRRLRFGEPVDAELEAFGVRWIAALPDLGTDDVDRLIESGAASVVIDDPTITLLAVNDGASAGDPTGDAPCVVCTARGAVVGVADAGWLVLFGCAIRSSRRQMTDL